jgi:hypothetical protein
MKILLEECECCNTSLQCKSPAKTAADTVRLKHIDFWWGVVAGKEFSTRSRENLSSGLLLTVTLTAHIREKAT